MATYRFSWVIEDPAGTTTLKPTMTDPCCTDVTVTDDGVNPLVLSSWLSVSATAETKVDATNDDVVSDVTDGVMSVMTDDSMK